MSGGPPHPSLAPPCVSRLLRWRLGVLRQALHIPVAVPRPPAPSVKGCLRIGSIAVHVHGHWETVGPLEKANVPDHPKEGIVSRDEYRCRGAPHLQHGTEACPEKSGDNLRVPYSEQVGDPTIAPCVYLESDVADQLPVRSEPQDLKGPCGRIHEPPVQVATVPDGQHPIQLRGAHPQRVELPVEPSDTGHRP